MPACIVTLEVTASKRLIEKAHADALKEVGKEVILPGFRKGKAPIDLIQRQFSTSIADKGKKLLADYAFASAFKLAAIPILNDRSSINFKLNKISEEEASFTFSYETEPLPPTIDPKKFVLQPVQKQVIGEKEMGEALKQMQMFFAKWTLIADRPVQEGDYILIDLETNEDPPKKIFSDTRFEVSDSHMATWMKKLVLGKKPGDICEGISEADPDMSEEQKKAFLPKRVLLTLKKIETAELPPFDDDFAKKVGGKTMDDVRKFVKEMLENKAEEAFQGKQREQVSQFLLQHPFYLPVSLMRQEIEHRKTQLQADPRYQHKLKQMTDLERAVEKMQVEEAISKQSEGALRIFYASRQIIRDNQIPITQEEVEKEALNTLKTFGPVKIDPNKIPQEVMALALSKVILSKAQEYILKNCLTN